MLARAEFNKPHRPPVDEAQRTDILARRIRLGYYAAGVSIAFTTVSNTAATHVSYLTNPERTTLQEGSLVFMALGSLLLACNFYNQFRLAAVDHHQNVQQAESIARVQAGISETKERLDNIPLLPLLDGPTTDHEMRAVTTLDLDAIRAVDSRLLPETGPLRAIDMHGSDTA